MHLGVVCHTAVPDAIAAAAVAVTDLITASRRSFKIRPEGLGRSLNDRRGLSASKFSDVGGCDSTYLGNICVVYVS
jgi:hypothetical protein